MSVDDFIDSLAEREEEKRQSSRHKRKLAHLNIENGRRYLAAVGSSPNGGNREVGQRATAMAVKEDFLRKQQERNRLAKENRTLMKKSFRIEVKRAAKWEIHGAGPDEETARTLAGAIGLPDHLIRIKTPEGKIL